MKINSKILLLILSLIIFLGLAFFAVYSKKTLVNKPADEVSTISEEEVEEGTNEVGDDENQISLEITSPGDGDIFTKSLVSVTGKTVPGADVFINDTETKADAKGNFDADILLDEGENDIFVVVNDSEGNYSEASIKVSLNTE